GAREHNLKDVHLDIPRDQLVVMTGVSGSGKSSLAFDTVFAEGQRKYMESLSAYARQFLDQMQKPDVDAIEGLPPTIAIEQRSGGHTPRSTVATTTEIYDYLRLLYARCGQPTCWHVSESKKDGGGSVCGKPISATSASQIVQTLVDQFDGKRAMLCSPIVRGKKGFHRDALESIQKQGFVRARVDGKLVDLREALKEPGENPLKLGRYELHDVDAVIDRIAIGADARQRLAESVEAALKLADGNVTVLTEDGAAWSETRYSEKFSCPEHPECSLDELEPRLFSFNSPHGACPACAGLGKVAEFDERLVVPDLTKGLGEGAIDPWRKNGRRMNIWYARLTRAFVKSFDVDATTPIAKLPAKTKRILLYGLAPEEEEKLGVSWEGVLPNLKRRYHETESQFVKERLSAYMSDAPCASCGGKRLKPAALAVRVRSGSHFFNIAEVSALNVERAIGFFASLELDLATDRERRAIAAPILKEINARLGFLASVGLGYLSLDRTSSTLSGGEAQRIRLATQVGSGLVGVCYVLDEPTIGLHQRDNDRLVATLRRLSDIGNTVLVVEHDEDMIRSADWVVDVGPGPGRHGGEIVASGPPDVVKAHPTSLTGAYLSGRKKIDVPLQRRQPDRTRSIVVKGARANNLKRVDVTFPLGTFICVTGVSGSGKSTLVNDILLKSALVEVQEARIVPAAHDKVTGLKQVERVVEVDQSPIGRTPRSNPATYTGIFDDIRKIYTMTAEAKIRGYEPGRFSFNVKGGRCEECQGQGVRRIEMHFLPDVFVTCDTCKGSRYNRETLEVRFRGKTIAEVLELTIDDAASFFESHPKIHRMLECLREVGLGYVQLGQASTTLSGGEAQRVKLAAELGLGGGNGSAQHSLYVLDEPTTGLHFDDVKRLIAVLGRLADAGHTLVVIEHNLDVIKCADWIIDLGPEGGDRGGTVIATGTPEDLAAHATSFTGYYLKHMLKLAPTLTTRTKATVTRTKKSRATVKA
ncbi:MAG: excinuclease ABC subunit UvrA, partial [Phycisphaerae bacterium]|nr:excinuclease ABC subunit UvrA [Phycisphaerae bacterium]